MVPKAIIDRVREVTDLVALVSRHVKLKKNGREFKGLCPFHQEKHPSFHVIPEKRFYFCHGCRATGDAIAFVMRMEGKPFIEAVRLLAQAGNIPFPGEASDEVLYRQRLLYVTQVAAKFFSEQLWMAPADSVAWRALTRRGLREDTLRRFGIGLAPLSWNALTSLVQKARLTDDALSAGLITLRRDGQASIDVFRNRLMIPLRGPDGDTYGFCGRLLLGEGPPFLYSKTSELFRKNELLFGWDFALTELRLLKRVLFLQSFTDCMLLHQVGVHHAVGVLSEPPTLDVLKRIRQLGVKEAQVLLPQEGASLDSLLRWARVLLEAELPSAVVELVPGQGLETLLAHERRGGLEALLASARPLSLHLFDKVLPRGAHSTFEEKLRAVATLTPLLSHVPEGLSRSTLVAAMATHFGVSERELEDRLKPVGTRG